MRSNFLSRWVGMSASTSDLPSETAPDGPVEDLIISGTAFGFGLFNLIFSLLPKKVQCVDSILSGIDSLITDTEA